MDTIIKLENINFWYDKGKPAELYALRSVNLEVEKGEYVAFFGPSGSGKTTLLYLIAGIEQCQEGKILINGRDISSFSKRELAIYRQVGVGMIFQQFNLIPSLTVLGNVMLPMSFLGTSQKRAKIEALNLLDRVDIRNLASRYPHELSGGQQQRVGIVRALANNPPIIVADEPLGNLDSENARKVLEFLRELNEKDKRTVIMVTHEAWSLKDVQKVFYMKDGAVTRAERSRVSGGVAKSLSQKLYSEMAPELSGREVAARTLAYLLLRGYSDEEVKRFEFFLTQRMDGKIDKDVFRGVLDKSFRNGGVGLWRQKAIKVSNYVDDVMEERKKVEEVQKKLETHPESSLAGEVERVRSWLLKEYAGKISGLQIMQIDELVFERLKGIISSEVFRKTVNLPKSKSGVGFSLRSSQKISEKLELLLEKGEGSIWDKFSFQA